ncbi:MAG: hypothetical protein ACR2F2_06030 [Pyrinomonadaceae bacterium]
MREVLTILPDAETLKKLSQSLAMLDAIISPDWEYRYYSFNSKWSENEMTASMRDGSGDDYFILFNSSGAIIKGFVHESSMSPFVNEPIEVWKGVLDKVPIEFKDFLSEPAFSIEATTFCIWRKFTDSSWQIGEIDFPEEVDPDGMDELLKILDNNPSTYKDWAEYYFGKEFSLSAIEHIYQQKPLTNELVKNLNDDISIADLQKDIEEIGYPD